MSRGRPRSKVDLLVLRRSELSEDLLVEDFGSHICSTHEHTHRSLLTGDEENKRQLYSEAKKQLEAADSPGVVTPRYTREMLADLLEFLVAERRVKDEFRELAEEMLDDIVGR